MFQRQDEFGPLADEQQQHTGFGETRWLLLPILAMLILLPGLILFLADREYLDVAALAYLNVCFGSLAVYRYARARTLGSIVMVLFLPLVFIGPSLGSIYFTMFDPAIRYELLSRHIYHLTGGIRFQLVHMLYMAMVITGFELFRRRQVAPFNLGQDSPVKILLLIITPISLLIFMLLGVSKILHIEGPIAYLANGTYLYCVGLFIIIGTAWPELSTAIRGILIVFLIGVMGFFALGNARGTGLSPTVMVGFGVLFLSRLRPSTKLLAMCVLMVLFVVYLVIGNTTRSVLRKEGSSFSNLGDRIAAMGHWQEVAGRTSALGSTFARLFPTGGHSIITRTPDSIPYRPFSVEHFGAEVLSQVFIPGVIHYSGDYSDSFILRDYDFYITNKTSVELTTVASLWMLGGWVPVIIGGLALGVFFGLVSRWLDNAADASPLRGLFYLGMIAWAVLWAENLAISPVIRSVLVHALAGALIWYLCLRWFFLKQASMPREEYYLVSDQV